jgi:hypothetical protein
MQIFRETFGPVGYVCMQPWRLSLLLSVCTPTCGAQYDMTDFQQMSPHEDTGFYASTLQHIWDKYNTYQGSAPGMPHCVAPL